MYQMLIRAFEEDKDMIGAQSARLAQAPDFKMFPLHLDSALTRFRRLIDAEVARESVLAIDGQATCSARRADTVQVA